MSKKQDIDLVNEITIKAILAEIIDGQALCTEVQSESGNIQVKYRWEDSVVIVTTHQDTDYLLDAVRYDTEQIVAFFKGFKVENIEDEHFLKGLQKLPGKRFFYNIDYKKCLRIIWTIFLYTFNKNIIPRVECQKERFVVWTRYGMYFIPYHSFLERTYWVCDQIQKEIESK